MTLERVAELCGYSTYAGFYKAFIKYTEPPRITEITNKDKKRRDFAFAKPLLFYKSF